MAASPDTILSILRASIDPEKCGDMEKTVGFTFTDVNESYGFVVRHGVGQIVDDPAETAVELQLPYETLVDIIVKNKDFQSCLSSGEIVINGDPAQLQEFMGIFDIAL